jgi:excinuclease ABC subunit C
MTHHLDVLRLEAADLPQMPGVYFWRSEGDQVLYIGKAVNLRRRVSSYFPQARKDRRIRKLLKASRHVTCEVTETELEALFRESACIKEHRPPYNQLLITPRLAWYIKLDGRLEDPYMRVTTRLTDDGSQYFGPFPSGAMTRETMSYLHEVLPLRKCAVAKPLCEPCIYFQMHKCAAPPLGGEYRQRHVEAIDKLQELLDGRSDLVLDWLHRKRAMMSNSLLFEQAGEVQRRIEVLNDHGRRQAVLESAVQSRCVVVHVRRVEKSDARALLVARGHVVSSRSTEGIDAEAIAAWVIAHRRVMETIQEDQNQVDSASVLQRWLSGCEDVRWVVIPKAGKNADLAARMEYLLSP